ncbi:GldM family protein [Bacteroides sp. 224]|uniref:GldM family protein n=1 Tax=Bacteroides sp. 224 TaxID=2302936 RepID=UPI0013D1805B|nr:GldM family protein [Bacteroides sp. 224]NDV64028.1 hypothetical protein [Bacteroides sp. 224]
MKHIHLLCLLLACFCYTQTSAQCDHTLVEKAAAQSGPGAVYLREFKVKFDGSERGKAVPVAKYPVLLSKNMTYRFNVCNSEEYPGRVILQLYLKDKLIGSTFDMQTSTDLQRFDFTCPKAATYEVVMSFDQGKPGCAVGILSLLTEAEAISQDEELDILYALADNPINIYDDEDEFANIEVSIDNGSITNIEKTNYIVRPEKEGTALLSIRVLHRDGSLKEFKQKKFAVLTLNKPYISIRELTGDYITKEELIRSGRLELWFSEDMKCNYRILSFVMSDKNDLVSGISSTSARFSRAQRDWLQNLPSDTRIYIKSIQVQTSEHTVIDIDPIDFIMK